jgi:hypothetical protein
VAECSKNIAGIGDYKNGSFGHTTQSMVIAPSHSRLHIQPLGAKQQFGAPMVRGSRSLKYLRGNLMGIFLLPEPICCVYFLLHPKFLCVIGARWPVTEKQGEQVEQESRRAGELGEQVEQESRRAGGQESRRPGRAGNQESGRAGEQESWDSRRAGKQESRIARELGEKERRRAGEQDKGAVNMHS